MRETTAAAARRAPQAARSMGARVRILSRRPLLWWPPFRTPRLRIRNGIVALLLGAACGLGGVLDAVHGTSATVADGLTGSAGLALLGWFGVQIHYIARTRDERAQCRAWDENRRPLRIELL